MEGSSYFLRADRETGSAGLFLSFLSHCHGGSFLENALCFLSFLSPCHGGYISENAPGGEPPSLRGMARDSVTGGVREGLSFPKQPFCGRVPTSPSVSYAEGTPFSYEKKRGEKIRKPTRLERVSTQASPVKRGLRLWKQQPKQSPPFG